MSSTSLSRSISMPDRSRSALQGNGYAQSIERKRTVLLFAIILAAAAEVRLYRLDHFSYGLDEILQSYMIQGTSESFWKSLKFDAVHPPLDYLVARSVEALGP